MVKTIKLGEKKVIGILVTSVIGPFVIKAATFVYRSPETEFTQGTASVNVDKITALIAPTVKGSDHQVEFTFTIQPAGADGQPDMTAAEEVYKHTVDVRVE